MLPPIRRAGAGPTKSRGSVRRLGFARSPGTARGVLSLSRAGIVRDAERITGWVFEEGEFTDRRDRHGLHDDAATERQRQCDGLTNVVDRDRALEAERTHALDELSALLQRRAQGWGCGRRDEIESRRPPRLEPPAEEAFVERLACGEVVRVDGEVRERSVGRNWFRHATIFAQMVPGRLSRSRQAVSRRRQLEGPIRSFGLDVGPGGLVPPQPRGWGHLVSLRSGVAELRCGRMRAFVTPGLAIWIPDGTPYALDMRAACRLRILYADDTIAPLRAFGPVAMTPLLRELVERAVQAGFLDPAQSRHRNVLSVLRDELASLRDANATSVLALPVDPALRDVAERLLAQPDDVRQIRDVAASAGMSLRTFERRFARETGLAPRDWVRRARLIAALASLATGASVTEAGFACGYSSISAFISAFRALHGVTPGSLRPSPEA